MKDLQKLNRVVLFLQSEINRKDITELQKKVCNRTIWYIIVKNYGLQTANERARAAYKILYTKIRTGTYVKEVFDKHLGEDYFVKKNIIKNFELYKNLENNI